jgi:hypothetical protein
MTGQESQTPCQVLAEAIREASRAGNLVGRDELLADLTARGLLSDDEPGARDMEALLAETLAANEDLAVISSISGEILYHAPSLLSRTYAAILDRKTSPVLLIAEEVRKNSAEYPRPRAPGTFRAIPLRSHP